MLFTSENEQLTVWVNGKRIQFAHGMYETDDPTVQEALKTVKGVSFPATPLPPDPADPIEQEEPVETANADVQADQPEQQADQPEVQAAAAQPVKTTTRRTSKTK